MVATHLGVVDEDLINDMSYVFFDDVLAELGHKLVYDAVVNYAGNGFCEKSWDMITEHNPLNAAGDSAEKRSASALKSIASFLGGADLKVKQKDNKA